MELSPATTLSWPRDADYTLDEAYAAVQSMMWSLFFGLLFAWALSAILTLQVYTYFTRFAEDRLVLKCFVGLLAAIETGALIFITIAGYKSIIVDWGHLGRWDGKTAGLILLNVMVSALVHALYAWRLWHLMSTTLRGLLVCLSIVICSVLGIIVCACVVALRLYTGDAAFESSSQLPLQHIWLAFTTIADVITCVAMYSRFADIRTTGSHSTIMQRIILALIPGGLLAAILTVILIIVEATVGNVSSTLSRNLTLDRELTLLLCVLHLIYSNSVVLCFNLRAKRSKYTVGLFGEHRKSPLQVKIVTQSTRYPPSMGNESDQLSGTGTDMVPTTPDSSLGHGKKSYLQRVDSENSPACPSSSPLAVPVRSGNGLPKVVSTGEMSLTERESGNRRESSRRTQQGASLGTQHSRGSATSLPQSFELDERCSSDLEAAKTRDGTLVPTLSF
ncbi:hypothetical protein FA09DRAFT_345111 [Tilletiopsis washingtonensis]|uniref:Uncharacterized protein n=1 Tax=Tilletiopsis washingtonensis TaxID=58919 RepID=A0A316ZG88_9BASI|nr:hypothetical protein FA09DRAFT_345111 [Tilletiopsis washingtonensis]PWO00522.1 hypothetical protein FA09DRAFT_345111 [Tilletiopsis washingtonensis]